MDAINGGKDSFVLFATPYGPMKWSVFFWGIVVLFFCYLGSVLPIWRFAQPVNYVAFWLVSVRDPGLDRGGLSHDAELW